MIAGEPETRVQEIDSSGVAIANNLPRESDYWEKQRILNEEYKVLNRKDRRDKAIASKYGKSRQKTKSIMQLLEEL